jgi:hypothetical protein
MHLLSLLPHPEILGDIALPVFFKCKYRKVRKEIHAENIKNAAFNFSAM